MARSQGWLGTCPPLTHLCMHTLVLFIKEGLVTDHDVVEILSYCKAFFKGKKKKKIVISVTRMHADELLEKGIWQNEKQGMKGP